MDTDFFCETSATGSTNREKALATKKPNGTKNGSSACNCWKSCYLSFVQMTNAAKYFADGTFEAGQQFAMRSTPSASAHVWSISLGL